MSKRGILKFSGFVGTVGAGAALVAAAAGGTGAWFTDAKGGDIYAQAGHLKLSTTDTNMIMTDLMPGEDRQKQIGYDVDVSSGNVDIWVKFDTTSAKYAQFTGAKGENGVSDGGMGRYGHFAVAGDNGNVFETYNLQNEAPGTSGCANADGHGFGRMATGVADTPPYCGVPGYIKVASNLSNGAHGNVVLTFGLTGRQRDQYQVQVNHLPFEIVATQAGHRPDAANF